MSLVNIYGEFSCAKFLCPAYKYCMCGIVGYSGSQNAKAIVMDGLRTLEYRGYDSAGVALGGDRLKVFKTAGRVNALDAMLPAGGACHTAIGHTRWATHGKPNAVNAHPHLSYDKKIAVVHNGVLENCAELKSELAGKGISCVSETDSELLAHLLALEGGDMLEAVRRVGGKAKGSATFLAIREGDPAVYVFRKGASMLVAKGEYGSFAASDGLALARYVGTATVLQDDEYARITHDVCAIFKDGARIFKSSTPLRVSPPKECACHMRAEIDEIPAALERTYLKVSEALDDELADRVRRAKRVMLAGCGTAFHACRYGKLLLEQMAGICAEAVAASEADEGAPVDGDTLALFVTQSGETADTLLAMKRCAEGGAYTVAVTNVESSGAALAADKTLFLDAGAEVAVAATKSYCCQLLAVNMLARRVAGDILREEELKKLTNGAKECIARCELFEKRMLTDKLFLVGRGQDLVTAKEGALKLKEITYRQAEAYAAGELKHGPIALIDSESTVIALATREDCLPRMRATVSELRSRGAYVVGLSGAGDLGADKTVFLPSLEDVTLRPILCVLPLQELALCSSLCLGLDPDKPRNLAKSVTVI